MIVSETPYIAWMGPFSQLGHYVRMYGPQGNLDEKVIAAAPHSVTNGDVISAMFTSLDLPAWKDYRAALKQYKAATSEFYDTFGGQGTWAAYLEFAQIIGKMKAKVTNKTFLVCGEQGEDPPARASFRTWICPSRGARSAARTVSTGCSTAPSSSTRSRTGRSFR